MDPEEYDRLYALEVGHGRFRALHRLLRRALLLHLDTISGEDEPLILDAGCGTGGTALALADLGRFVGIDRSERALQWAARRSVGDLARASLETLPFPEDSFDAVLSVDVLYHRAVADDVAALSELARVCKPRGVVLIWVAAYEWMRSGHDAVVHTARRYTRRRVLEIAELAGLEILRSSYTHASLLPFAIARRCWSTRGVAPRSNLHSTGRALNALLSGLLDLEGRLSLRVPLPFGLSVYALLRKPSSRQAAESE